MRSAEEVLDGAAIADQALHVRAGSAHHVVEVVDIVGLDRTPVRLQVDREGWERHEPGIPLDFLGQFAQLCRSHGMRGKFSVLPYPAGLGSILEGWEGCDRAELAAMVGGDVRR